jgi:hypothetical protein
LIYVRQFPIGGAKWTISNNGGTAPKWNPSGHERFFLEGDKLMAVSVEIHPSFKPRAPVQLFSARTVHTPLGLNQARYDPAPGGQRFVVIRLLEGGPRSIVVVQNWLAERENQ